MDDPNCKLHKGDSLPPDRASPSGARALLNELFKHPGLSGLGVGVARIVQLIDRAESALQPLTQAIMAEPFITQRLIRAANAALRRRGTAPVITDR